MAIKTTLEQIEEVQAEITKVMSSQSYRIGNITYKRAALSALTARETMLLSRYQREEGASPRVSRARLDEAAYRSAGDADERTC